MKQLKKIQPYSNKDLTWNEETKKYELTLEFCKSNFESNFRDDEVLKKRIEKNTKLVYRFIHYRVNAYNRRIVNKVINYTEEGREFIKEMLATQMDADVQTGFNDLSSAPAVNLSSGQIIDRNQLYSNQVSVDTEEVFDSSDAYFGFRIGYQAPFPAIYFLMFK